MNEEPYPDFLSKAIEEVCIIKMIYIQFFLHCFYYRHIGRKEKLTVLIVAIELDHSTLYLVYLAHVMNS